MNLIISTLIEANKLLDNQDYYNALNCFETVLAIEPANNLAIIGKTVCLYYLKSDENTDLIKFYKNKLNSHLKLVELYGNEKFSETIEECDRILKQDKHNFNALAFKFSSQYELTNYEDALDTCDKLLELDPDDNVIIYAKATTLYKLNIYEEAIEYYDKILEVTNNFNASFFKAASLLILNRFDEALKSCEDALMIDNENNDAKALKQLIEYKISQK